MFIFLGSFLTFLVDDGIGYTFGILKIPVMEKLDTKASVISWAGSLNIALMYLGAPFANYLNSKFGMR